MAEDVLYCKHCGGGIQPTGYCGACGLKVEFVYKALNTSKYYYNIGLDKARVRDMTGAKEALKTALKYDKMNIPARNLLGLVLYETGEVVEALSHWVVSVNYDGGKNPAKRYIKDVKSNPHKMNTTNSIARKYNQALVYAKQGSKDLAFIQLRKILSENTKFVNGYLLMALLFIDDGKYDKARKALKRVIKIDRTNPLAVRYFNVMGHSDEEIMNFRDFPEDDYDADLLFVEDNVRKYIEPEEIDVDGKVKPVGPYRDVNLYKYSLAYVVAGIILGAAVMWFLVLPQYNRDMDDEARELKISYSQELASKNTEISSLEANVDSLTNKNAELESQVAAYQAAEADDLSESVLQGVSNAIDAYETEEYDDAINMLYSVIDESPEYDVALYYLALCYHALEDESSATAAFATFLKTCPDSIYYEAANDIYSTYEDYEIVDIEDEESQSIDEVIDTDNE